MAQVSPLTVTQMGTVTLVEFGADHGLLDALTLERLRKQLVEVAAAAEPPRLLLDLSRTTLIGSSFIELLFRVWNRLSQEADARFGLVGLSKNSREVLSVTHLDRLWRIYDTHAAALSDLEQVERSA